MSYRWRSASASLREEDYEKLRKICREQGLTVNQLLRRLIYNVIEKREEVEPDKSLEVLRGIESKVDDINKRLDNAYIPKKKWKIVYGE